MNNHVEVVMNGILTENPTFVQVIGMCPTLAVTTGAINAVGMGLSVTAVLTCSNLFVSLIRKFIPDEIRIPSFIVVIATFVTIVQMVLKAFIPSLDAALGLFIPLIVVNCIILARAEAYASKNDPISSIFDGIGMGLGFTIALTAIGIVREILGSGTVFGITILPEMFPKTITMILPPGAFFTLAFLMIIVNKIRASRAEKAQA